MASPPPARAELASLERDAGADAAKLDKVVDLPAAQRELAALLSGAVRVIEDDGEPVAELRLSAGTLVSLALGSRVPRRNMVW